ncbi:MAG: aminotransferase class V-fold PLP-dependent enzyme, partial [Oscillospiraceae bacterium]
MIYLDNAATSYPKPSTVIKAVSNAMVNFGANPGRSGHTMAAKTAMQIFDTRESIASFFGVENMENVSFTQNCTYAINLCVKGFLKQGDHVIISDLEHNAVLRPIYSLAQKGIITFDVAKTYQNKEKTVKSFEDLIVKSTRLIICTHGSNVFGIKLPIYEIGGMAKKYGIYFLVDAAQTAGTVDIDIKNNIDFICMPGHKGLYGPSGTGVLIINCPDKVDSIIEGGTGSVSLQYEQPDFPPDKFESGTINTTGIIGLGAGISFAKKIGCKNIHKKEMMLSRQFYHEVSNNPNVILYTEYCDQNLPVISFNIKGKTGEQTTAELNARGFALRGGFHCSPLAHKKMQTEESGTARVSFGY